MNDDKPHHEALSNLADHIAAYDEYARADFVALFTTQTIELREHPSKNGESQFAISHSTSLDKPIVNL